MKRITVKKYILSDSPEARKIKLDALYSDTAPAGNLIVYKHAFICLKCNRIYAINEMKELKI